MTTQSGEFPTRTQLWRGAILNTIAHAVWFASKFRGYYVQWDGDTYVLDDAAGTRGAIVFGRQGLVGTFCSGESRRAPWLTEEPYDLSQYFMGMPAALRTLADRALQYFIYDYRDANHTKAPAATTAFWGEGEQLTAAETWPLVVEHGAFVLETEVMETDEAMQAMRQDLELSAAQTTLVYALYTRKIAAYEQTVVVRSWEREVLVAAGDAGIEQTRTLLADVGVVLD